MTSSIGILGAGIVAGNIGIDTRDDSGDLYRVVLVSPEWLYLKRITDNAARSVPLCDFWKLLDQFPI